MTGMTVLYIIIGIIFGVPVYLLLNTVLMLISRLFVAMTIFIWPYDDTSGEIGKSSKILGWLYFILTVLCFVIALVGRFIWLVYQVFRSWFEFVKFCWNLGSKPKAKVEIETETETE